MKIYCMLALSLFLLQAGSANAQEPPAWLTNAIVHFESSGNPRAICFNTLSLRTPSPEDAARIHKELDALGLKYTVRPQGVTVKLQSLYPATEEEGRAIVRKADELGLSIDIGLGQINIQHPRKHGFAAENLLDPEFNLQWCKKLLADELQRHGRNWRAVGRYHSPDPERGRLYAWNIYNTARRIEGEKGHGKENRPVKGNNGVPDAGGIRGSDGQRQTGANIELQIPEAGQHRPDGEKP